MAFELCLMRLVPGKPFYGPVTPGGNIPVYTANGVQCFAITVISYFLGAYFNLYHLGVIYDQIGFILSSMNIFSLLFCLMLYLKGRYAPSTSDWCQFFDHNFKPKFRLKVQLLVQKKSVFEQNVNCKLQLTFCSKTEFLFK